MNCGHSCAEVFRMFEGYYGPYFTPSVDAPFTYSLSTGAQPPASPTLITCRNLSSAAGPASPFYRRS